MGKWTAERWAAASGVGFVILLFVGSLIQGTPKKYDASAADITSWFHDKHRSLIVGALLFGLAYILFLWFLASFAGAFREAGERRVSTVMYGAGVALIAVAAVMDGITLALARMVALGGEPATIKTLWGVDNFVANRIYWLGAALALATFVAARRTSVLPVWFAWLSLVGAVVFVLGGLSVKTTGFFSVSGGMPLIALLTFLGWILIASLLLVRRSGVETTVPRPATAGM